MMSGAIFNFTEDLDRLATPRPREGGSARLDADATYLQVMKMQ